MIELPDLFHENRVPELSLSLILYAPFGLCLVLLRSIALLGLFLISSVVPASASLQQLVNEAIALILTLTYDNEPPSEGKDSRRNARVIVANRVSPFDGLLLRKVCHSANCKVVNIPRDNSWLNGFKLSSIDSCRNQEELLDVCVQDIHTSESQLIFLPEYESTTGSHGLLKFNLLPFTLAQKLQLAILPVCLQTSRAFQIRTSVFNSHPLADLFWSLFSPYTKYHLTFLPAVPLAADFSDEAVCEQVRASMSRTLGVEPTQFDENEVLELKKRPELFQRRHAQRRAEFQQMINLVHQQVPVASLEAIRYDLETTKNVQKTIANLKERAEAAARAASRSSTTSSSAMPNSSSGSSHRQTYERLKQELIEKNRQLFLNKNCN